MSQYFSDQLQELQERAMASELTFRRNALEAFHAYGMPQRKQDPWKYVDNSALLNLPFDRASSAAPQPQLLQGPETADCYSDICFVNDQLALELSGTSRQASLAWSIRSLELTASGELNLKAAEWQLDKLSLSKEENSYSLINAFSFGCAYELKLEGTGCLRLRFSGDRPYQAPRLYIRLAAEAKVQILLDTRELGAGVYWNPYLHFDVAAAARLTLLERGPSLNEGADDLRAQGNQRDQRYQGDGNSSHVRSMTLRGQLAENTTVNSALFYWGMQLAVHDARFAICGENADLQMRSICFGEGRSAYHLRCENQHLAANSQSRCLYKNVLFDKASSEFYGIIHADNNGVGTDAVQQNQNLLLSDQARAIARPQLEILIDDLKCRHGSSTGSINAEELFYMRSRGLNQSEAMRLAVVGFVEEISTYFEAEWLDALGIEECLQTLLNARA